MGGGSSKPGSSSRRGKGCHRSHSSPTSWAQAHVHSSRPAAPTNLNVNRALGAALSSSNGQRHHHQPKTTTTKVVNTTVYHRTNPSKPVEFLQTNQSAMTTQVNRNNQPKSAQRKQSKLLESNAAGNNRRPRIDYRNKECGVCGHTGHSAERCHHRHNSCHICLQPGHLASVCTQKTHNVGSRYRPRE